MESQESAVVSSKQPCGLESKSPYLSLSVFRPLWQPGVHLQHPGGQAVGEPGVLQNLGEGHALLGVGLQHALDEHRQVGVQAVGDLVVSLANPLQKRSRSCRHTITLVKTGSNHMLEFTLFGDQSEVIEGTIYKSHPLVANLQGDTKGKVSHRTESTLQL